MSILRYVLLIFLIVPSSYALDDSNDLNLIRATKLKQVEGKKELLNAVKKEYIAEVPGTSKLKTFNSDNNLDTKLYHKVKLIDVVLETLSRSDILKSSRESVIQNELKVKNAIADYYPTLNFNYEYGRTRTKPGENEGDKYKFYTDNNFEFILRQNLYSGNSTYNNIKSVSKKLEVARNQYRIKLDEEIKKAIKAYFDVVFTNRSVMVNERNMKKLNKILEIVTAKYESGAASIGDLTSIKANVANALTKLVKVKSKFVEALRYYEYIVGTQFQKTIPYEKNFNIDITDFDLLYQRALKKNRNLINYYKSIEAEKFNQKNKRSAFEPKIDFELAYGKTFDGEDIEEDETDISGKVKFTYNLFNGGRDKNKVLEVNSKIRDLSYKLEEEKKKVKWNLSKIHTSVKTVRDALESTIEEIKASRKMVTAYWEAFKLGEQDLNTLLQGQRQLNSAETELVNFEKNQLVDFFNILELTGELSSFFDVNPDSSKFIDFSKSDYKKTVIAKDGQNLILVEKEPKEVIEEKKEEKPVVEIKTPELSLKEKIDNYLKQFINFDDESFMIVISDFDSIYDAFNFMIENDLDDNSFAYDVVEKYNIKTKIAHNNFQTKEKAEEYIKQLKEKNSDKKYEIKNVSEIKKLYNEYIEGLEVKVPEQETKIKVVEKLIKPPEKKVFKTNPEFKEKFLNANNSFYTINVSSFTDLDALEEFINKNKIYDESFFFKYGNSGELLKLVTGIYEDYTNIEEIINKLILENENVFPIVEKISSVKTQYNDNLIFNENKLYKSNLSEKLNKKEEADQLAKIEAKRLAKIEAEKKVKEEAERLAKIEAEKKAKEEAARQAKIEADKKAKEEAARQAKIEAEKKAKEEAERLAKIEAEKKVKEEAERLAKIEAEKKVKEEAERLAKIEADKKAKEEAEILAKIEAEQKAKEEADRLVKIEAEKKAKEEAERLAKIEVEKKAKEEAERLAKIEAEKKAKEEAERLAKIEADKKAKEKAERLAKIEAEKKAKEEAVRQAKIEAEKKAKEEAARQAKIEAEQKAKEEAERQAKLEAEKKAKEEAERLAKIEAEKKAKEEAARQAKIEAEQKAKEEAERLEKIEADKKAKEEAEKNPKYTRPQTTSIEEVDFGTKVKEEFIPYKKRLENFRDEFKTVPKDKFTLEIATLKPSEVDWFVSARAVGPYYVVRDASNKVKLYYGIYETKEEAKKATETLHPVIYESNPPIKQIGSVR
ncbi:TolC family protein [Halarcobacter sp.]|uniref:TolC family protein n=1 Tax=Halarcobacter sp. TaxID=2321133 RepID=UPI0029F4E756|nr:TolC family protein [Halarcobacter sp.]